MSCDISNGEEGGSLGVGIWVCRRFCSSVKTVVVSRSVRRVRRAL